MKILVTGGTGFIGKALSERLLADGHRVTVTGSSRSSDDVERPGLTRLVADTTKEGDWQQVVAEQDVLVNLAGRSIFHRWSTQYKKEIKESRILTTRNLVQALPQDSAAVLLSASAVGFYGNGGDHEKDESSPPGNDFLAEICREWEAEAQKAEHRGARVIIMRLGVVLGAGGGAIDTMKLPFETGLGGPMGNGRQWFPWIHIDDLIQAFFFVLSNKERRGIYNFTAPDLVRQKEFAATLGRILHRPALLPAPTWAMKLALGEFGRFLLQGQKVVPKALLDQGFKFAYPELQNALAQILSK